MNKRERDIKKFKKKRLAGPILFLLIYLVIAVSLLMTFISSAIAIVLDGYVKDNNKLIQQVISRMEEYGDRIDEEDGQNLVITKDQLKGMDSIEEIVLLDKHKKVLFSTGECSYDLNSNIQVEFGKAILLYPDKNESFQMDLGSAIDQWQKTDNMEVKAAEAVFWYPQEISSGRNVLMFKIRQEVPLRTALSYLFALIIIVILTIIPIIIIFWNIISSFINQRRAVRMLYWDGATGGNNWVFAKLNGTRYLEINQRRDYAVVDFELMKYRSYCTCHGVEEGENLLEAMNHYFKKKCTKREMVCHHSKANFCLILQAENPEELRGKINGMFRDLSFLGGRHHIDFHAGVLYMDAQNRQDMKKKLRSNQRKNIMDSLYQCAGAARAEAASTEGNAVVFYNQNMLEQQLWEHKVEDMMEEALHNEEFLVYLQPKYNPTNDRLIAAEALVRWNSPTEGFVAPGRFIPIFEKTGFVTKLDDYMISHVAALQAKWLAEGKPVVPISVNVSRAHFANPELAEHIKALVDAHGTPYKYIEIELTESAFFDDKDMILDTVKRLQSYGFEVSMDDFGSGYSSLNSLKDLPLDILKLDAEFFRGEDSENRGKIVVSEAIHLAKSLNMKIVAEGVEKKDQVDFLANNGCDMIQGYYYAKPMPTSDFELSAFANSL